MSKKITEITIETEQVVVIRRQTDITEFWCNGCSATVRMVTPEQAALLAQVSARTIYRRVETGELHFTETPEGMLLICLDSLTAPRLLGYPLKEKNHELQEQHPQVLTAGAAARACIG